MKIEIAKPPNFDAILKAFPEASRAGVIFTYGDTIFNPSDAHINPQLKAHEAVHYQRQEATEGGPAAWWERYIEDRLFRAEEEALAHRAEYRAFRSWTKDRNVVSRELHNIADRLASPLYGGVMSYTQARRFIVVTPGG